MLRRSAMVVVMLLVSLVMACSPQAVISTPTPAGTGAAPKAASGAVSVATPKPAAEKPLRGGTLVYGLNGDVGEVDPQKVTSGLTRVVARLMFNTLVTTDANANIIPELAESWSYPDPNTLVFKLRKGVKFHDGTDFNAEAVKFNVERVQDPATKLSPLSRTALANITSVEVVDDHTVKFNLKTPEAPLLGNVSSELILPIVSPAAVKKLGAQTVSNAAGMGTGPFEFVEWVRGDHLTVKRFDGYWRKDEYGDPLPYLDQVIVKPIPDPSVMLTNLRTGNVDLVVTVLPAQVPLVKADNNLKMVNWGTSRYQLVLNTSTPPFDNKALRQAVAWAVDREAIHKSIYGGIGAPAKYILTEQHWAFNPDSMFYVKDNAKAKEKLAEGGKPQGFKFVAKSYAGTLEMQLSQAMQSQLAEVGIDMEIVPLEESTLGSDRSTGKFIAIFSKAGGMDPDPDQSVGANFNTKGGINYQTKYNNPEVDKLTDSARVIYDQTERKVLYAKAQDLILDGSPVIFLRNDVLTSAMNQKVMGFTPNTEIYRLQLDWMWLKK